MGAEYVISSNEVINPDIHYFFKNFGNWREDWYGPIITEDSVVTYLKMGVIFAIFNKEEAVPVANDLLKICERIGAISLTIVLSNLLLILSISLLLLDLSLLVISMISSGFVGFRKILFFWLNEFREDW